MIYRIDPLQDCRWAALVDSSSRSSVFHSVPWLTALQRTYGYVPIAYTASPPHSQLEDAVVVCRVASWLTGRRLVSLPFSDHCNPLVADDEHASALISALAHTVEAERLGYFEIRSKQVLNPPVDLYQSIATYAFHQIDLHPDLSALFGNCHESSIQRRISHAEREALTYDRGRSEAHLEAFWRLHVMTRRRHQIPPQPKRWFRNLIDCFGQALDIRIAWKGSIPIASILTLIHKDTIVYKYGCSDAHFHRFGGTVFLFWKAIEEAKGAGLQAFDLGRTDWDNVGLLQFKERWGSRRSTLTYSRFTVSPPGVGSAVLKPIAGVAKALAPYMPAWILRAAGSALYRHIG